MSKESEKTVTVRSPWVRLPTLILFVVIFDVVEFIVVLVMLVQFVLHLFTGRANANLRGLGATLGEYAAEIVGFLTYRFDEIPYPFGPWPKKPAHAPSARKKAPPPEKES